jgi:capsular exopolysaccharide synthesis family protein
MSDNNNDQIKTPDRSPQPLKEFNLIALIPQVLKNWYWFMVTIPIALLCARFYISHTLPIYRSYATVLIDETDDRPLVDNSELLVGLGLPGGMKNIENQIAILKSRSLTKSTLEELPFEIEYFFRTFRNKLPVYPEQPIALVIDSGTPLPQNVEFAVIYQGDDRFTMESVTSYYTFSITASFGEVIETATGKFSLTCRNFDWLIRNLDRDFRFVINSPEHLITDYTDRLSVDKLSRDGSMLRLSLEGTNRAKDVDFLNKHIEGFQAISLAKKNAEVERRLQFIDSQLVGISDSLSTTESKLQQFRSSHQVMDISAQGQSIIAQVTLLETERARLNLEANYYDYLADYLSSDASGEIPIVPITMGIEDPSLTRLVEELAELQGQLATRGAGEMNPLQRNLEQKVRTAKEALKETLNGLRRANGLARSENQQQLNKTNARASSLPVTERQLIGIERKFRLNDELYTFLLEARAEQEMQKASNRADSEVIDPADEWFSVLISPKMMMVYLIAFFLGFFIPLLVISLRLILNTKLRIEDIKTLTKLPVIGVIPHNTGRSNTVVFQDPSSIISESFRLLRSRMQFFTKETVSPVVLVTSAMPGDGKTFASINLASVYSLLGKKTILVGFDLRKPKIFGDFQLNNEKGVSTWLIGIHKLQEIIQKTEYDNLDIIPAGPVPPNPSELTALEKTKDMFVYLRKEYDFIIVDSSPIGLVSDTYHLASLANACILVIRPDKTIREGFINTLNEVNSSGIKGVSLVINDVKSDYKHYGYGEKYGYTNHKERSRKFFIGRNKKLRR